MWYATLGPRALFRGARYPKAALTLLAAVAISPLEGQQGDCRHHDEYAYPDGHGSHCNASRWRLGGGLAASLPTGTFANFGREGIGAGVHAIYGIDPAAVLGLRLDGAFLSNGSDIFSAPIVGPLPGAFIDVRTRAYSAMFAVGPQISVPAGPVRPYVNAVGSVGYFYSTTSVQSYDCYCGSYARTTIGSSAFGYGFGGGLDLQVSYSTPVFVTLDAQWRTHGAADHYLGSFVDETNGIVIETVYDAAEVWLLRLGVSVGL